MASISFVRGKYRALVRRKGYKSISKSFPTEAKAKAWARDIEGQIVSGKPSTATNDSVTIGQLIEKYRKMRSTTRPILDTSNEHYVLKQLKRTLGEVVASRLTVDDLIGWATSRREEGAGPYTINCDLSRIGTVFRYAGEGLADTAAAARPKLSYLGLIGGGGQRERRPTNNEAEAVLQWLAANRGQCYADFAQFAALTAMRRGEVARLLWSDLQTDKKMVLIRDRKDPRKKSGNDQWVPLLGKSWELALQQPKVEERIFPIHPQTMSKYFTEACRALSIPDLHLHDLRHEGISTMFEQGFDIPQVALVSGHKDWRHLRRYTNLKPESLHDLDRRPGTSQDRDSRTT